ncbi:uncharacterized protein K441DRAFT_616659 [Cenococcum geophilum 1.58]|uniref:uncharacterized protein n=1 Tax=Cenococcum geophilum 1.58 TaxID=794803 RepID=UPI00358EF255|nr:hypothetical protein K441DRAFT_616659 [Cenococcum geophilum 1.58]
MLSKSRRVLEFRGLRSTVNRVMMVATKSAPESSYSTLAETLTDKSSVATYLKETPFASREIRRINLGSTNFTYRLFLEAAYGQAQEKTTILKYFPPYTAGEPCVKFSSERQVYEARAMTRIPWQQFGPSSSNLSEKAARPVPQLRVPKLYFEDLMNHVIIMEDCNPRQGSDEVWEEITHSARIFFEGVPESSQKHQTAEGIGQILGSFIARLHNWGKSRHNAELAFNSFTGNSAAKELIVDETFRDFFSNLDQIGFQISKPAKIELEAAICDLEEAMSANLETVVMGDFWPGNVLLSFNERGHLKAISIIDWEFVMLAPAFVDLGHFLGEVWLISYFESNDAVYITLLESFIKSYQDVVKNIDIGRVLGFAAAHITMALPRRVRHPRSRATMGTAIPCLEQALKFITDRKYRDLESQENDAFDNILQFMRDRRNLM